MNLETAAYIYRQSRATRDCILSVCDQWNVTLDDIRDPKGEKFIAARNCLIYQLANLGLPMHVIDGVVKAKPNESYRIITQHRTEYRIPSRVYA